MDDALDAIYWRDELLQILYWLHGEGLGETVTPDELLPFLEAEATALQQHLDRLADDGYVTRLDESPARYQLTEWGIKEGGRRFADEFAGLTGQAQCEGKNPNCACKTLGPEACSTRESHVHS